MNTSLQYSHLNLEKIKCNDTFSALIATKQQPQLFLFEQSNMFWPLVLQATFFRLKCQELKNNSNMSTTAFLT